MSQFTKFWKNSITIGKGNVENGVRGLAQSAKESGKTKKEIKNHLKFAMHGKDVDVDKIVDSVFGKSEDTDAMKDKAKRLAEAKKKPGWAKEQPF